MRTLDYRAGTVATLVAANMTANEIIGRLAALPSASLVPVVAPLTAASMVAGIEVAATSAVTDSAIRRVWRERHGGSATPLLLLANDVARAGSVQALGTNDPSAPLRCIEASALIATLERVASKPRLEAIRELASELERLDQTGVPGLTLRNLLTIHTLDRRLRQDAVRWRAATEASSGLATQVDWRTTLVHLGYALERLPHRGWLARFQGRPIAVIHPFDDPGRFARLDAENRPPEGALINDCLKHGAGFGILASGGRMRLFEVAPPTGSAVSQYLELDANVLQVDDRAFLGLLAPAFLAEGEFARLRNEAQQFGAALRKRLDRGLRESVLPSLGRALGRWAKGKGQDLRDDQVREELQHAALTFVFRALFLAYAESGGHLPMDNRSYSQASLVPRPQTFARLVISSSRALPASGETSGLPSPDDVRTG